MTLAFSLALAIFPERFERSDHCESIITGRKLVWGFRRTPTISNQMGRDNQVIEYSLRFLRRILQLIRFIAWTAEITRRSSQPELSPSSCSALQFRNIRS